MEGVLPHMKLCKLRHNRKPAGARVLYIEYSKYAAGASDAVRFGPHGRLKSISDCLSSFLHRRIRSLMIKPRHSMPGAGTGRSAAARRTDALQL